MIVQYKPEGGESAEFVFDARKVRSAQAEMIEKRAGMRYEEWTNEVLAGSARARRVLLWHCLSLTHPGIKFDDVDFAYGELTITHNLTELLAIRASLESAPDIDDEVRAVAIASVDEDIAARREAGDPEPGKASD